MARPTLLGTLEERLRLRRYSPRTAQAYLWWVRRYVRFCGGRHPRELGERQVTAFLSSLAVEGRVAASTQNQALAALLFLYRELFDTRVGWLDSLVRAKKSPRVPVILSREEVERLLAALRGVPQLFARLLYGTGLRLGEGLRLRIKDVDFDRGEVIVRGGKGDRDRVTMLPNALADALRDQVGRVRRMHVRDRASGRGGVSLPDALARKAPSAVLDTRWQWVFPATRFYRDPVSKRFVRHHLHRTAVQRAVADAAKRAGIDKRVGCHTLRHCFATHLLEGGYDIRTIQELMGHRDIRSTMIYCHALNRGGRGVRSPLDSLSGDPRQPTNLRSTGSSDLTRGRLIEGVHVSTKWRGDLRR